MFQPGLFLLASAGLAAARQVRHISVPSNLSTRVLLPDVYGYSLEPVWVDDYLKSDLATNLMSAIASVTGKPPPFRVGGNTADQTYLHPDLNVTSIAIPTPATAQLFNVSPAWYDTWANYFPDGTDLLYTINLRDNSSSWANAVAEAAAVHKSLGSKLTLIELGNEIDHFINERWRGASWGVAEYIAQFRNLTGQIMASDWYASTPTPPRFQAAVFADPPWVPDQQDEIDDFDIVNLTRGGLVDAEHIASYSVHLYPQSTCDSVRWHRMRLDVLSNHTVLWLNVSQYIPQVAAADAAGSPLVLGETNSISCSGRSGISDTFGAALWGVDYVLLAASIGIQKVYFHLGAQSEYSSFTPVPYVYKNESLAAGIRAGFYGHYFLAQVVRRAAAGEEDLDLDVDLRIAALPSANASDLSGYGVYDGAALRKLVFLDMGVWNGTQGLGNPSTLGATDGTTFSHGRRPVSSMRVWTPWTHGARVNVTRLSAPGTNAKSKVDVSGVSFDTATGAKVGKAKAEVVVVGKGGVVTFDIVQAEAVLLEVTRIG